MQRLILAMAALALPALAQTLVAPTGYSAAEGASNNAFPWSRATASMRFLQLYDSTHFTGQGANYPIIISRVKFRANATAATWAGGSWPNIQIDMSTAAVDYLAANATFASNHGGNLTNVLNGPVTVTGGTGGGTTVPGPWYVDIPLTTPFLYDPTSGSDLAFEVRLDGAGWTGASTSTDAISGVAAVPVPPLGSRVFFAGVQTNLTGTVGLHHMLTTEFTYLPAAGLYAGFSANVTAGLSPLAVNFTDSSFSSALGGITSWSWDFNGDNVVDSTLQNPSHVYTACGTYTVRLTVTDASFPASTETKVGYIKVDAIVPSFTASVTGGFAPVNVSFTNTSTGPVQAWLWDLDGDTIIDSSLQNPTFVYTTAGNYTVSLNIVNACNNLTLTKTNLITVLAPGSVPAAAEILQYQFNEVRGNTVANTATTATAPAQGAVSTTTWQTDPNRPLFKGNEAGFGCLGYRATGAGAVATGWTTSVTGSFSASFWLRKNAAAVATPFGYPFSNGTFRSFVGGAALSGITFRGSAIGNVDSGFTVDSTPGVWQHLCLVVDDAAGQARWYNNGAASATVVSFTPNTFTYTGPALIVGSTAATGGSVIGIGYDMDDFRMYSRALVPAEVLVNSLLGEAATAGSAGSFCNGPGGTPVISTTGVPSLGNATFAVNLSNAENARLAAIVFGFTPAAFGTFDLSSYIGAGCELQINNVGANFYITASNAASQPFVIPPGVAYKGLHVYGQWVILGTQGAATRLLDINIQ